MRQYKLIKMYSAQLSDLTSLNTEGKQRTQTLFYFYFFIFLPIPYSMWKGFPVAQMIKHLPAMQGPGFNPWVGKIPWRRKWQSTAVLLPGKSHGQRILVGYSPSGHNESDTTEQLHFLSFFAVQKPLSLTAFL